MARRWMSMYQPGTAMTTSDAADLSSCAAESRSFPKHEATSCVAEEVRFSPRQLSIPGKVELSNAIDKG